MAKDLATIAASQLGNGGTVYQSYTGTPGQAWCQSFVCWCCNKAGAGNKIKKTASTSVGMQYFKSKNRFEYKESYFPARNDIIYFKSNGASHVGIVESASGNYSAGTIHTIEGNYSNKVCRVTHKANDLTITGYGLLEIDEWDAPYDLGGSGSGGSSSSGSSSSGSSSGGGSSTKASKKKSSSKSGKEELKYLKQFLKTIDEKNAAAKKQSSLSYEISKINYHHEVKVDLTIQNGKKLFAPPVIEGLKVVWERKNTAGKMTFQTILSSKYKIREGNPVLMSLNGKKFFYGFVFTVKHSKDGKLDITVYDQLRYLKNKDTYVYKKKPTDALIRMIARDMGLNVGTLAKTKYAVTRAEDNLTLFDIISNSLNETLMATGNTYTLYDNCGKLMLKKPTEMKVTDCLIDADTAEDYSYSRSIDQDVYNQIKLEYQNENSKKIKFYYTRSKKNIGKWGTLQYFEKIDYPKLAKTKGKVLLKLYNRVSKTISVSGAFGNPKVRAGSLIPVLLDLGDAKVSSFLLVDKVTHMFENGVHKMDLDLSGGGFDSSE